MFFQRKIMSNPSQHYSTLGTSFSLFRVLLLWRDIMITAWCLHLIEAVLQFQMFSPLSITWSLVTSRQAWCREGAESSLSWFAGSRRELGAAVGITWAYETLKPTSTVLHFLQQDHPYSNCTIYLNSASPYVTSIQTHEPIMTIPIYNLPQMASKNVQIVKSLLI